jgi:ceramide glucosyltransferase
MMLIHATCTLLGTLLALSAFWYLMLTVLASLQRRRSERYPDVPAPVSILKPLCGSEPRLLQSLRSFCRQDHPCYEVIFGVRSKDDPAVQVVESLKHELPQVPIRLIVSEVEHGRNPKISNLLNMLPYARHEYLVIADSDIEVGADYLRRVTAPLNDERIGVVTCAYAGVPLPTRWARIGAEFINGWFIPSVYVAAMFGSRAFAFGATLALRRSVLMQVGGLGVCADQLADDYRLGELTRRAGFRTVLSDVVVRTSVTEASFADLASHQLRWLRTIRAVQPMGYALCGISFAVPVALIGVALTGASLLSVWALGAALFLRMLLPNVTPSAVDVQARHAPLAIGSDFLLFGLWLVSFWSRRVRWRGVDFLVRRDGAVSPIARALPILQSESGSEPLAGAELPAIPARHG